MNVVGVQMDIVWEDPTANREKARGLIDATSVPPGSLVVLPEMYSTGFTMDAPAAAEGDARPGETFLAQTARQLECTVLGGVVTMGPDGRGRNEAVAFGPDGEEIARYCKLHPFSFAGEDRHYAPGEGVVTFRWGEFTVAPAICYDLRFPEAFRAAIRRGAELLVVIANWPAAREAHWLALARARAIENQAYLLAVNRCGADPDNTYSGRSIIIDPQGDTLADAGDAEGVIHADLDIESLRDYRRRFPALADIRDDLSAPEG